MVNEWQEDEEVEVHKKTLLDHRPEFMTTECGGSVSIPVAGQWDLGPTFHHCDSFYLKVLGSDGTFGTINW